VQSVQRIGGWSDADTAKGKGLAPSDPQTGWNVEEHAVGTIRRIPLDGLTGGLQGNPGESASAAKLTRENVAGKVKGPARSDKVEQKGRGRAIALVPTLLETDDPVEVLCHLHGNTEKASRGFAGWRQHKTSREVRDVARDRIAQQIESANSPQIVGLLPQGVMESNFGQISVDAYIRDAFDRLVEIGAWTKAPTEFSVVLSSHSGGGFTIGRMLRGVTGYQLPANLKTLVLFESLHDRRFAKDPAKRYDQVEQFATFIEACSPITWRFSTPRPQRPTSRLGSPPPLGSVSSGIRTAPTTTTTSALANTSTSGSTPTRRPSGPTRRCCTTSSSSIRGKGSATRGSSAPGWPMR
jgi:hypothetical protein